MSPGGCLLLPRGYIHVLNHEKRHSVDIKTLEKTALKVEADKVVYMKELNSNQEDFLRCIGYLIFTKDL